MPLTDLLRSSSAPTAPASRPLGITCDRYAPGPDGRRCASYLPTGACACSDEFMCREWLRANDDHHASPRGTVATVRPYRDEDDAGSRAGDPSPAAGTPSFAPSGAPVTDSTTAAVAPPLTQADIDSFKALGVEVRFAHPEWGEFWLVPEYTDQDRLEITPEHLAKVSAALRAFGGKVVRFGRVEDAPEATAFSLAAARAHLHRLVRAQAAVGGTR